MSDLCPNDVATEGAPSASVTTPQDLIQPRDEPDKAHGVEVTMLDLILDRERLRAELAKVQGELKIVEELFSEEIDARLRFAELLGIKECRACEIEDGINAILADRARLEADCLALRTALTQCHPANIWDKARMFYSVMNERNEVLRKWHHERCAQVDAALSSTAGDELRAVLVQVKDALLQIDEANYHDNEFELIRPIVAEMLAALSRFLPIGEEAQ